MALKVKLCKDLNVTIWHLTDKVDFSYFVNDRENCDCLGVCQRNICLYE